MAVIDLRTLRQRANLKQGEVADQLGIDRSYLSRIENGERRPDLDLAERYIALCGGHLVVIFDDLADRVLSAPLEDRVMLSRLSRVCAAMHPSQRRDLEALIALWERQVTESH